MTSKQEKEFVSNITKYFRQSLIDAERVAPSDNEILSAFEVDITSNRHRKSKGDLVAVTLDRWDQGVLLAPETALIFKIIDKKCQEKKIKPPKSAELVFFPRVDLLKSIGGARNTYKKKVLLPLLVFVNLNRQGQLFLSDKPPWIPRVWLSPSNGQDECIGDLTDYDKFISGNPYEAVASWQDLTLYCEKLVQSVTEKLLSDTEILADYRQADQAVILVEPPIVGAKEKIKTVLEKIIDGKKPSQLYNTFVSRNLAPIAPLLAGDQCSAKKYQHVGQMTDEFSLSKNQRNALHHFLSSQTDGKDGNILAVNGPPGTGKTTLIRSIVANCWVNAALNDHEPPVIVAASNNNQAVTNILEDFARVEEKEVEPSLQGRWIPKLNSYGLYCPAQNLANDTCPFPYHGPKGEGLMESMQMLDYLVIAEAKFLLQASAWSKTALTEILTAKEALRAALKETIAGMKRGLDSYKQYCDTETTAFQLFGSEDNIIATIADLSKNIEQTKENLNNHKQLFDKFYQLLESRAWWVIIFAWLPPIKKHNKIKNARFLIQNHIDADICEDDAIENWFKQRILDDNNDIDNIETKLNYIATIYQAYTSAKSIFLDWFNTNKPPELYSKTVDQQVDEVCDRIIRFKAFKLATHYWEAAWLLETRKFVESNDNDKQSPLKTKRKWRRFAKLTPCFVSTFYMVPSFHTAYEMRDGTWEDIPLFNFIDLLIVDEAGQVLPEVAAATFSLAKRAVIVGDVDQIEPVWSVPASIDKANLSAFNLLQHDTDYDDYWLDSGHLASAGNIMRVGQRQCPYHQFTQLSRGLYLTEHRRCYDSIIEYCNDLVYQGVLEPMRGNPENDVVWEKMGFIHVEGSSQRHGKSRYNAEQANSICRWLVENRQQIEFYAQDKVKDGEKLSRAELFNAAVAVVTPFAYQSRHIQSALTKHGLPKIVVGTVHKLQGAERLIVLFSSVYGDGDQSIGKFYDSGHNMLNVAVSRAKDSFIVFGHRDVFGKASRGTPSGKLKSRLTEIKIKEDGIGLF